MKHGAIAAFIAVTSVASSTSGCSNAPKIQKYNNQECEADKEPDLVDVPPEDFKKMDGSCHVLGEKGAKITCTADGVKTTIFTDTSCDQVGTVNVTLAWGACIK